jgi:two-component system chemotaxis response regulator CheB
MVEASKIKVLVVDDSAFMRLLLCDMLASDAQIEVVGTATNGNEAWKATESLRPEVVLLDLVMPDFDGVYATQKIMTHCPCAILLLTAQNPEHSTTIWEALACGAVDFMLKPAGMLNSKMREQSEFLVQKIRSLKAPKGEKPFPKVTKEPIYKQEHSQASIVAIGASTGGTSVIEYLLSQLPKNFVTPIVIAQHIPATFAQSFAKRLQENLDLPIMLAMEGIEVSPQHIYILPADGNMILQKEGRQVFFAYTQQIFPAYNTPSIDALFQSIATIYQDNSIAILLTGMGADGAQGMEQIFQAGGYTIAQDQASCVVFGMPREAIKRGAVCEILSPEKMLPYITFQNS